MDVDQIVWIYIYIFIYLFMCLSNMSLSQIACFLDHGNLTCRFHDLGVHLVGVLAIRALLLAAVFRDPDF